MAVIELIVLTGIVITPFLQSKPDESPERPTQVEKVPAQGAGLLCGNAALKEFYSQTLAKGAELERTGKHAEAVGLYLHALLEYEELATIPPELGFRVAELYVKAGREADLRVIFAHRRGREPRGGEIDRSH